MGLLIERSRRRSAVPALLLAALLVVPALAAPGEARAAPTLDRAQREKALHLAEEGDTLLREKKFVEAESRFREAIAIIDAPTLRVGLAHSLEGQGRLREAKVEYQLVLEIKLDAKSPQAFYDAAKEARTELATLAPRVPRIKIVFADDRKKARATVDGHDVPTGEEVDVDVGSHDVTGPSVIAQRVEVKEGEVKTVTLGEASAPFPFRKTALPALVLGGVGLVAVGIGVGFGVDTLLVKDELDAGCSATSVCPKGLAPVHDHYVTSGVVSMVSLGVGVASLAAGTIVFFVGDPTSAEPSSGSTTLGVGLGSVSIRRRF